MQSSVGFEVQGFCVTEGHSNDYKLTPRISPFLVLGDWLTRDPGNEVVMIIAELWPTNLLVHFPVGARTSSSRERALESNLYLF